MLFDDLYFAVRWGFNNREWRNIRQGAIIIDVIVLAQLCSNAAKNGSADIFFL